MLLVICGFGFDCERDKRSAGPAMPGLFADAGELAAYLVGARMLDVLVDGERLLPDLPRPRQLAGGMAGVTKVGEGVRFGQAVAEFPSDAERALVAGGGFAEVAQMVLSVAQGVPRVSLCFVMTRFHAEGQ